MVPLSKIKDSSIVHEGEIRTLAVQPLLIKILENMLFNELDWDKINKEIIGTQAGFIKGKSTI